jgi:TolB protein
VNVKNRWPGKRIATRNLKVSGYLPVLTIVAAISAVAVAGFQPTSAAAGADRWGSAASSEAAGGLQASGQTPDQQPPAPTPQQPSEVAVVISGDPGTPPRYAIPDFLALNPEAAESAKTVAQVLWDDFTFEREFYLIPRDTYASIPVARSPDQIAFSAWNELGADAVVFGTVRKTGDMVRVEVRLVNIRTRQSVFGKEYTGTESNPRLFAHTIADEIHQQQRALRGVARTKLAFSSDRNRERVAGSVENRDVKEIYISDYDGANTRRITTNRQLNLTPVWAPDARSIAYTSYRRGYPDLFIALIYQGLQQEPTKGGTQNWLPMFSPDGTRIVFTSSREGNPELYIINRDGSGLRRLTNHPAIDTTPTWSPTGTQIAFTSDRAGQPQIYIVGADGLNLRRLTTSESYADRPTWSPAPFNEIAFAARTGPGYDIKIYDLATGMTRQITFGEGSNESPAYAANGRHLAFTSTRTGRTQVFTIGRDGRGVRQVTRDGNNFTPSWSN